MRSKSPYGALSDMLHNIELAPGFVSGMSFEAFRFGQRDLEPLRIVVSQELNSLESGNQRLFI
jgi:hypothetical protein